MNDIWDKNYIGNFQTSFLQQFCILGYIYLLIKAPILSLVLISLFNLQLDISKEKAMRNFIFTSSYYIHLLTWIL
ncbi:Hypothetical predicted protein [Octopus vulgaris]|uniref:Uncharacterized protein n=1 Tax=Octopus vulgaris TaxID=6645 RepID=A0AA36AZQ0_OCTVU|nr:Hypothetical predicted protein [Octopus vulgaris]